MMKLTASDGRNGIPSLSHLTSGTGKPMIWACSESGSPVTTVTSLNGFTNDGARGSGLTATAQIIADSPDVFEMMTL